MKLDHLVLTVKNIENTIHFYTTYLGMKEITFKKTRKALVFGTQKINLHQAGKEFLPKAQKPTPGSADLCFLIDKSIYDMTEFLTEQKIPIIEGPVERTGATSKILSIYIRDPDYNLIELANPIK